MDTLSWQPSKGSAAKGTSATRRFAEFIATLPSSLAQAVATPGVLDVVTSSFVSARLRVKVARRPIPEEWKGRPVPEPTSVVRGETFAIIGLLRLAALLPSDSKGSMPCTRRVLRKTGCLAAKGASPRSYPFLWELVAAWESGAVPRNNPQAIAAFGLFLTAIHFLLRPRYVRATEPTDLLHEGGCKYRLDWGWADKSRPGALAPAAAAAASARPQPQPIRHRFMEELKSLPAKHPRITASQGKLLHEVLSIWRPFRGPSPGPLFCRTEAARQQTKTPKGSPATKAWTYDRQTTPAYMWTQTPMSEKVLKRWLVFFLTPIIGQARARKRVLSGLRGGGEMELVELRTPVSVRATLGWWVARRLSAEGALITYEGSSLESMWAWTALLGTLRIRVLAPGVFRYIPHSPARGIRRRRALALRARETIAAAERLAEAAASVAPQHAAPHTAARGGAAPAKA